MRARGRTIVHLLPLWVLFNYVLVANYLVCYVIWLIWLPTMYVVALLEERELRERFGQY